MDKRRRLIEAAFTSFTRTGFHGTTTADVAREANVATGTFFTYFSSKEELINCALHEATYRLLNNIHARATPDDILYHVLGNLWEKLTHNALAEPSAFNYWVLFWLTPKLPRGDDQKPLPLLGKLDQVLARELGVEPAEGRVLHALFLLHWQCAVQWVRALPNSETKPHPRLEGIMVATYEAWWDMVGIPKSTPFRPL